MKRAIVGWMSLLALIVLPLLAAVARGQDKAAASPAVDEAKKLNAQVVHLYGEGKYDEAIALAKQALAIWERERGQESAEAATTLVNLAELYKAKKNYSEAEGFYRRALKVEEHRLGKENPELAKLLIRLGWMQHVVGQAIEAEGSFKKAVALKEKQRGAEHPEVADALSNLALFYQKIGKPKNSLPLYERMIAIREKAPGPDKRDLIEAMEQSHCALNQSGKEAEAAAMQERIVQVAGALPADTIRVSGGVLQGKAVYKQQPHYPPAAKAERLSGTVYIKVEIDEAGNVINAKVLCGPDLLAAASLEAARKWRFAPTTLNGRPVKVQGVLTLNFVLQ